MKKFLFYLPRILSVIFAFALFRYWHYYLGIPFGILAIDLGYFSTYWAFIALMICEAIYLGFMIFTWKFPKIGGYIYSILSLGIIALLSIYGYFIPMLFVIIPLTAGILFVIEGDKKQKILITEKRQENNSYPKS